MLRQAVRIFMRRKVLTRPGIWMAACLAACIAAVFAVLGDRFFAGLAAGLLVCVGLLVAAVWLAHLRGTLARLRAMDPPEATLLFNEDALVMTSNMGSAAVPWSRFSEMWELPDFWMLILAANQFITLPRQGVPEEAFALMRSKVGLPGQRAPSAGRSTPI